MNLKNGSAVKAEVFVKDFIYSHIGSRDEELASIMGVSTKTISNYKNGKKPLALNTAEKFMLRSSHRHLDKRTCCHFSELATCSRVAILRSETMEQLEDDAYRNEELTKTNEKDWGIWHLAGYTNFRIWLFNFCMFSTKNYENVNQVSMLRLQTALFCWKKSASLAPTMTAKSCIDHNISTTDFLLKTFGEKCSRTGALKFNNQGSPVKNADIGYYNVFKSSAQRQSSIHAWRDAIEMAVYLNDLRLINESLSGFIDCVDGQASLQKKGRKTALGILQSIDNLDTLSDNLLYAKIVKSLL